MVNLVDFNIAPVLIWKKTRFNLGKKENERRDEKGVGWYIIGYEKVKKGKVNGKLK